MRNTRLAIYFIFYCAFSMLSTAQTDYGILFAQQDRDANCPTYNNAFVNRPKEVGFNTVRRGDKLYLRVTDDKWLKNLMRGNLDGIAIDVLASDQYACEATFPKTQIRGVLLKPVYKVVLLKELKADGKNGWLTPIGLLPAALRNKSLEFNILFLSNKTMCQYYNVYNLDSYPWNLLDMGIYLDKVVYSQENISNEKEASKNKYKTLNFTVPFDKNKSEYSAIDVKPIYDSLNLTDYKISKIKINAYASVEGSIAINKKLQEDRGNSIIASLKSYIKDNIATEVRTSENWAEFFRDIQNTPYASLGQLSKEEIKQKLTGATVQKLEPILTKHRKGVVTIELTKIERFKSMSDAELMVTFNKQLQDGDLENALIVQKALFDRAMTQASPDILNKMEVPQQAIYADFNNNKAIFGYFKDARAALIAKNALKKVIEVAPKNKKAHYNIVAIDVFLLRNRVEGINEKDVRVAIQNLKKYGIANALIQRMMVNLNIIKAEQKNREKKYNEKDIAVKYIKDTYTNADLSASNYLSLAQFLTYYDNTESSIRLLQPVVSKVGVNEDLLYYYLNQTIVNEAYVQRDDYRAILNNAYGQNPQRFCNLFNASTEGGITFQLLNNDYLRRSYCENCRE